VDRVQKVLDAFNDVSYAAAVPDVLDRAVGVLSDVLGTSFAAVALYDSVGRWEQVRHHGTPPDGVSLDGVPLALFQLDDELRRSDSPDPVERDIDGHTWLTCRLSRGGTLLGAICTVKPDTWSEFGPDDHTVATTVARVAGWSVGAGLDRQALEVLTTVPAPDSTLTGLSPEDLSKAVTQVLSGARKHLGMEVSFVSRIEQGRQLFEHVDGDPDGLGRIAGVEDAAANGYCQQVISGRLDPVVPDTRALAQTRDLPATTGLDVRSYVGVPIVLPDGRVYGTLCCLSVEPRPDLDAGAAAYLATLADLISQRLARSEVAAAARERAMDEVRVHLSPGSPTMVAQPIVDLVSGQVVGLEALARFPRVTDVAGFFERAARLDLGRELETAAVREALTLFADVPEHLYVSINVSPETLMSAEVMTMLASAPPTRLVVEVTERVEVHDYVAFQAHLATLRERGVRIAVDDTGAGFASLQHVLELTPDIVKLDRQLVRRIDRDPTRAAMLRGLAVFGAEMGTALVAEGVEAAAELAAVRELGICFAQGFHLARPAPVAERPWELAARTLTTSW
jgi:EAL domain-containing protein (putative c-di-GMP-specific phosphodiesterase class I)/GAF domain-containing protein